MGATHSFMRMSKWNTRTKCGSSDKLQIRPKSRGFPYHLPDAVSALIMDQRTRSFFLKSALAGLKTTPGLLPVPYHQIIITPNINMRLIKLKPNYQLNR